jgi:phosphinothricin acetyltransferase
MSRIRLAREDDGARLAEIYRPAVEVTGVSFEEAAPDGPEMRRRISGVLRTLPWLVAEDDDGITGYAYASPHRQRPAYAWSVEVSIYVDLGRHRSGTGRQLYEALFGYLRRQQVQSAFAGIVLPNPPSEGFHRAMGFTEVGRYQRVGYKHGRWCDTLWMQRMLGDFSVPPPPVTPLAELLGEA